MNKLKQFAGFIGMGMVGAAAACAGGWLWRTVLEEKANNLVEHIKWRRQSKRMSQKKARYKVIRTGRSS